MKSINIVNKTKVTSNNKKLVKENEGEKKKPAKNGRKNKWYTAEERINNLEFTAKGISQNSTQKDKGRGNMKEMLSHGIQNDKVYHDTLM